MKKFLTYFKLFFPVFLFIFISYSLFPYVKEAWEENEGLVIEVFYRELCPGDVMLIKIKGRNIYSADAFIFQKKFSFYKSRNNNLFTLIGIDLFEEPGEYPIIIKIRSNSSEITEIKRVIKIKEKYFPLKKIRVKEEYVTPPPRALERIKKERAILKRIYRTLTPQYLFEREFILPVEFQAKRNFGERRIFNLRRESRHTGVDIPAPKGVAVKASNRGKVVLARDLYYSGNTVIIDHGYGLFSLYCHLSKITVKEGQLVKKGDVIGKVGATGRVTGPHLHWGFKLNGAIIDPYSVIELPLNLLE
ncbi:M23 family metallopeptidase [Candidatus Aminicenantes bacterium AC-335-A11]|jgi:murein DD-endopeptidase MepM/ murein hydrolase activator NlpD|nr:M23 family metallopeptidase [SCandidatus Aminicenantes bacterium Aminicenantia_JdfR_composite]MCP2598695.1 M23 family metallopeptidase [Candidatus Aminicenantes bacterium AC-335-L06]MCP2618126.1 M23 family metallopeptidase [Candidatus Aminicenantes bacterium AC-335-A11]